ncbi:hypothetical protein [Salinisphaera sp. Q1T1-3]|uniref:hypothetical protein n=1 Tax=Salinisphaera sp. Q1T1-3 TaxID=2321229 RepID=UPI000E75F7B4|nr:hypothetical protein [Salinisphaera sp. Q1T1-3]RJS92344.1 hypothetical protein D3260_11900 [Salinisphaera sp. Q1T1-3]
MSVRIRGDGHRRSGAFHQSVLLRLAYRLVLAAALAGAMSVCGMGSAIAAEPTAATTSAQSPGSATQRPLYLEIVPAETAGDDRILPADLVEAMARETLSGLKRAVITLDVGQTPPDRVQVLRIMVLTSRHQDETGSVYTAAATTSLFTTPRRGQAVDALRYQGMQQELVTSGNADDARRRLREHFKTDLARRVSDAMAALPGD